jgi:hypothetical protein
MTTTSTTTSTNTLSWHYTVPGSVTVDATSSFVPYYYPYGCWNVVPFYNYVYPYPPIYPVVVTNDQQVKKLQRQVKRLKRRIKQLEQSV